jgi:hypothetical protein
LGARPRNPSARPLGLIVGIVVSVVMAAGMASYFLTSNSLKDSAANQKAVQHLKESPVAREALGEIKEIKTLEEKFSGGIGVSARASFTLGVEGSKADGKYWVDLERLEGTWKVLSSHLQIKEGPSIDLGGNLP